MFKIFVRKNTDKTKIKSVISKREKEMTSFDEAYKAILELNEKMMGNIETMKKEYSEMMKGN